LTRPWRAAQAALLVALLVVLTGLAGCGGGSGTSENGGAANTGGNGGRARALAITPQQASLATWSAPVTLSLVPASAAVLGNGKLLLWSSAARTSFGAGGRTFTTLFDPASNIATEREVTNTAHEMFCPGTAMLPDGRVLVNGGSNAALTSIYDPASNAWTRPANSTMNVARAYNASTTLQDGSVLTVGGSWKGGVGPKASEVYTVAGGWRTLTGLSTATSTLVTSDPGGYYRSDNHMWLLPTGNGRVLHAGPSKTMNWLDVNGSGSVAPAGNRADDSDSMSGNAVMYDTGKILAVGGSVNYGGVDAKSDAFVIDTAGGTAATRRVGSMAYRRVYANSVVLPNGQVVVIGGQTFGAGFSDSNSVLPTELFDPGTETFTLLPSIAVPRNYHSVALLLPDARVVSAGGGLCNCAADHPNLQMLSPPYLFNADGSAATRPVITTAPASVGYGVSVSVSTNAPVTAFALVRLGATTHTVNNDQRRLPVAFTSSGGNTYSLAIPSNPGLLVPGQWMLFAMNAQGTPSVAKIINVSNAQAPVLRNPGSISVDAGAAINVAVPATTPGGVLNFSATGLPPGVFINPGTGVISGSSTQPGSSLVTVRVSNGSQVVSTDLLLNVVPPASGTGLLAQYFNTTTLSGPVALQRVEAPNFNWGTSAPGAGVLADRFSVRWTGWIEATTTGNTQIQTLSDGGVRVWVDNRLLIDNWPVHTATSNSASIALVAGRRYPVMLEYFEDVGNASLSLQWQPAGAPAMVPVPAIRLYASPVPATDNMALSQPATQSSDWGGASAARAVDGNTNGLWAGGSVTHTAGSAANDWWQVDLGRLADIDRIQLWNRSDCCSERLANFTVLVSPNDMGNRTLAQLQADASVLKRYVGTSQNLNTIGIPVGGKGRYVRVQLNGQNFLSLAEVQVFGRPVVVYGTPVMAAIAAQTSTVGQPDSLAVVASDPDNNVLSYSAAGLPPGLAISSSSGRVSGTPTTAGSFNVTVTARNAGNLQASRAFSWTVANPGQPTGLTVPAAPAPTGSSVAFVPSYSGGAGTLFSWDFGDGTPATPPSATAATSHVYAAPGIYTVTLTLRASDGSVATYRFVQAVVAPVAAGAPGRSSSDILLEPRNAAAARLWVVNADNDSVSVFDTTSNQRLAEISVGSAPRTLARAADGRIWVVNKRSASISVIDAATLAVVQTLALPRAAQPHGIVVSPSDGTAYVALEATGTLLKLNGSSGATLGSLAVGSNPRQLAITGDGARVLVSRFITRSLPGEATASVQTADASGNKLGGEVLSVNTATMTVARTTVLEHSERLDSESQGRGIPNYLGAPALAPDGRSAWVPSKQDNVLRGTLRDGLPLDFQNTVRAISSRIDLASGVEVPVARVDHDNASLASAALFHPTGAYLFVALETSREVAIVDAQNSREVLRLDTGRAPQGLAVSADGNTLYVNNFMDRSVGVHDLRPLLTRGASSVPTLATLQAVASDKLPPDVLAGKQLFYDARDQRLARDRYMSCASCHNDGGHDGRVWDLTQAGEGLRNTITLRGRAAAQGRLHWSANFDEVQDFEGQIRTLAGGTGLMSDAQFNTGTRSLPLGDRKAGVSADLDRLAAYVASLNSFDASPARQADGTLSADAVAGKAVFAARCASCHAGTDFSDSSKQVLHDIGTLKAGSGLRLNAALNGIDAPTLRDVWATAPYLHDGSAPTLEAAIQAHRALTLTATELATVVAYTRQIGGGEASAPASSANLVVRVLATLFDRVGALYEVRVNSQVVRSGQLDASGWVDLFIDVATLVRDAIVEVVFKNDASDARQDRNLAVQSIKVNGGTTIEATSAGVVIDAGTGPAAFDGIDTVAASSTGGWMPWDSAMRFRVPDTTPQPGTDTVTVRAATTLAGGVGAQIELRINGVLLGTRLVGNTSLQDLAFTTPAVQAGDRIDVVFTNDAVINGEDRNLWVQAVVVRGVTLSATAAGVTIDQGTGAAAFDGIDVVPASSTGGWLPWNAALRLVAR